LSFVIPVPSYTVNDPIGIFALAIAVAFGIAAFWRGIAEAAWGRTWSRTMRYTCSVIFILVGIDFMVFAVDHSGSVGLHGSGVTTNCQHESDAGLGGSSASHSYRCDIEVRWSDGTTTHEDLDSTTPVNSGQAVSYAKAPKTGLLSIVPIEDQPEAAWTEVWFYFLTGLVIFLQSVFALCVLVFVRKPKTS
jgi:hypothetical protein